MKSNRKTLIQFLTAVLSVTLFLVLYFGSYQSTQAEKSIYTGKEHHEVSLESAQRWTGNFQVEAKAGDIMAGYMGKNIFEKILAQKNCVGIRIYNARLDHGQPTFVLIGVDGDGNDIVGGVIGEDQLPCPPFCPSTTSLQTKRAIALGQ